MLNFFAPRLTNKRVREIVTDKDTIYIGTHEHGFYALNDQGKIKNHWHRNAEIISTDQTLQVNGVMTLLPTETSIWAGLWAGGLQQFDKKSGNKISSSRFYAPDTSTIGGKHIFALLKSNNGVLYVGHENGVSIILPIHNQLDWIGLSNEFKPGFSQDHLFSLYHHDQSWFAGSSSGGLYYKDDQDNRLLHLSPDSPAPLDFPSKSVWQITHSQNGDLLMGTANGVIRLNPKTLEWQRFGDAEKFVSTDVYRLTEAPDQTLWLSLWEGGVARLDQNGQLMGQWSQSDGLQQNTSIAIASNNKNQIFALNNAGLFRYDSQQDVFVKAYIQNSQSQCTEIDHVSTDLSGKLWALCQHQSLWQYIDGKWIQSQITTQDPILNIFPASLGHQPNNEQLYLMTEGHIYAIDNQGQIVWQHTRIEVPDNVTIEQVIVINSTLYSATN
ncbi:MAG: hypothetical protein AB8B80_10770 [Marinicellaceae bacterium]